MRAGRKPKPTWLKVVNGNPGRRRLNGNEPKPVGDLKDPPEWLTDRQKEGWKYALDHAPAHLLKKIDASLLVAWVVAQDVHRQAAEIIAAEGITSSTRDGVKQNPAVLALGTQAGVMMKAAAEMGFTPSSRARITIPQEDGPSSFDEFVEA